MHCWLLKDIHFTWSWLSTMLDKHLLKRTNPVNNLINKLEHYFVFFLIIKYLWMFSMSDLLIASWSTEKLYLFPFKDTSLDSVTPNPLDMLGKLESWNLQYYL